MPGSVTQIGGPAIVSDVKYKTSSSLGCTSTGHSVATPRNNASATSEYHGHRVLRDARRNPRPMPRKEPIRTKLLK